MHSAPIRSGQAKAADHPVTPALMQRYGMQGYGQSASSAPPLRPPHVLTYRIRGVGLHAHFRDVQATRFSLGHDT